MNLESMDLNGLHDGPPTIPFTPLRAQAAADFAYRIRIAVESAHAALARATTYNEVSYTHGRLHGLVYAATAFRDLATSSIHESEAAWLESLGLSDPAIQDLIHAAIDHLFPKGGAV